MREIKFRAINANNEIIYGLPYTDGVNDTLYFENYNNRLCWRDEKGNHCNQPYKNSTLMQYTGLKDKEGKEIYEGDIRKAHYYCLTDEITNYNVIKWDDISACFYWDGPEFPDFIETEIVGNIYENPELLTK